MKTDFQTLKKTSIAEILMTLMVMALVGTMLIAGLQLINVVHLPKKILAYVGGTLLSFVLFFGFLIVHNCVKFMFKKGE